MTQCIYHSVNAGRESEFILTCSALKEYDLWLHKYAKLANCTKAVRNWRDGCSKHSITMTIWLTMQKEIIIRKENYNLYFQTDVTTTIMSISYLISVVIDSDRVMTQSLWLKVWTKSCAWRELPRSNRMDSLQIRL